MEPRWFVLPSGARAGSPGTRGSGLVPQRIQVEARPLADEDVADADAPHIAVAVTCTYEPSSFGTIPSKSAFSVPLCDRLGLDQFSLAVFREGGFRSASPGSSASRQRGRTTSGASSASSSSGCDGGSPGSAGVLEEEDDGEDHQLVLADSTTHIEAPYLTWDGEDEVRTELTFTAAPRSGDVDDGDKDDGEGGEGGEDTEVGVSSFTTVGCTTKFFEELMQVLLPHVTTAPCHYATSPVQNPSSAMARASSASSRGGNSSSSSSSSSMSSRLSTTGSEQGEDEAIFLYDSLYHFEMPYDDLFSRRPSLLGPGCTATAATSITNIGRDPRGGHDAVGGRGGGSSGGSGDSGTSSNLDMNSRSAAAYFAATFVQSPMVCVRRLLARGWIRWTDACRQGRDSSTVLGAGPGGQTTVTTTAVAVAAASAAAMCGSLADIGCTGNAGGGYRTGSITSVAEEDEGDVEDLTEEDDISGKEESDATRVELALVAQDDGTSPTPATPVTGLVASGDDMVPAAPPEPSPLLEGQPKAAADLSSVVNDGTEEEDAESAVGDERAEDIEDIEDAGDAGNRHATDGTDTSNEQSGNKGIAVAVLPKEGPSIASAAATPPIVKATTLAMPPATESFHMVLVEAWLRVRRRSKIGDCLRAWAAAAAVERTRRAGLMRVADLVEQRGKRGVLARWKARISSETSSTTPLPSSDTSRVKAGPLFGSVNRRSGIAEAVDPQGERLEHGSSSLTAHQQEHASLTDVTCAVDAALAIASYSRAGIGLAARGGDGACGVDGASIVLPQLSSSAPSLRGCGLLNDSARGEQHSLEKPSAIADCSTTATISAGGTSSTSCRGTVSGHCRKRGNGAGHGSKAIATQSSIVITVGTAKPNGDGGSVKAMPAETSPARGGQHSWRRQPKQRHHHQKWWLNQSPWRNLHGASSSSPSPRRGSTSGGGGGDRGSSSGLRTPLQRRRTGMQTVRSAESGRSQQSGGHRTTHCGSLLRSGSLASSLHNRGRKKKHHHGRGHQKARQPAGGGAANRSGGMFGRRARSGSDSSRTTLGSSHGPASAGGSFNDNYILRQHHPYAAHHHQHQLGTSYGSSHHQYLSPTTTVSEQSSGEPSTPATATTAVSSSLSGDISALLSPFSPGMGPTAVAAAGANCSKRERGGSIGSLMSGVSGISQLSWNDRGVVANDAAALHYFHSAAGKHHQQQKYLHYHHQPQPQPQQQIMRRKNTHRVYPSRSLTVTLTAARQHRQHWGKLRPRSGSLSKSRGVRSQQAPTIITNQEPSTQGDDSTTHGDLSEMGDEDAHVLSDANEGPADGYRRSVRAVSTSRSGNQGDADSDNEDGSGHGNCQEQSLLEVGACVIDEQAAVVEVAEVTNEVIPQLGSNSIECPAVQPVAESSTTTTTSTSKDSPLKIASLDIASGVQGSECKRETGDGSRVDGQRGCWYIDECGTKGAGSEGRNVASGTSSSSSSSSSSSHSASSAVVSCDGDEEDGFTHICANGDEEVGTVNSEETGTCSAHRDVHKNCSQTTNTTTRRMRSGSESSSANWSNSIPIHQSRLPLSRWVQLKRCGLRAGLRHMRLDSLDGAESEAETASVNASKLLSQELAAASSAFAAVRAASGGPGLTAQPITGRAGPSVSPAASALAQDDDDATDMELCGLDAATQQREFQYQSVFAGAALPFPEPDGRQGRRRKTPSEQIGALARASWSNGGRGGGIGGGGGPRKPPSLAREVELETAARREMQLEEDRTRLAKAARAVTIAKRTAEAQAASETAALRAELAALRQQVAAVVAAVQQAPGVAGPAVVVAPVPRRAVLTTEDISSGRGAPAGGPPVIDASPADVVGVVATTDAISGPLAANKQALPLAPAIVVAGARDPSTGRRGGFSETPGRFFDGDQSLHPRPVLLPESRSMSTAGDGNQFGQSQSWRLPRRAQSIASCHPTTSGRKWQISLLDDCGKLDGSCGGGDGGSSSLLRSKKVKADGGTQGHYHEDGNIRSNRGQSQFRRNYYRSLGVV